MERERKRNHFKRTYEKVLLKISGREDKDKQREQDKIYEMPHPNRIPPSFA